MIYINGQKASKKDFETLKKWTKERKTTAKAKTDKNGNILIITKD
jgi:hypothetical protein